MGRKRLTEEVLQQRANLIYMSLKNSEGEVSSDQLVKETGLTKGQISSAVRYMRHQSLNDYQRFIKYYFISGRKGYKLPQSIDDYALCYASLRGWANSILNTIRPMERILIEAGFDPDRIMNMMSGNNFIETSADGSWGFDVDYKDGGRYDG